MMIRRFYSHYTFIYPDIYLKNVIVELDSQNYIKKIFPFEKEIANTEFYSGWLLFIPKDKEINSLIDKALNLRKYIFMSDPFLYEDNIKYNVYDEDRVQVS